MLTTISRPTGKIFTAKINGKALLAFMFTVHTAPTTPASTATISIAASN